ncbi:(2Fe-2S)-binding protein [Rhodococcus sp. WS1]|uniref:2Fe-2S iron-sulfur cluster-binding protein n=1 Tax=unclassified Rhodococcus (in: high G+C Gram-positive bacteria) TaxID=192944 RepID=UPI001142DF21|nr:MULTISPECIES: 2Fe-2S iron-sulfur cluster binding domain-containing protein [unclassified Rhodococcus (in: high G+C Gram-positive bacteria)]ROZ52961.1 (2Fe-2S)-binding protein [Rhodococcus sp. WS1]TQC36054.1 2Fe-2S iron-sulfur cluster binding domain-containing protein [Rhodococcus sp. WS7]
MAVTVDFRGYEGPVTCGPEETLLRAGLRAGLALPYECASGGCGSCRAQLVEGEVNSLWPDAAGLSERDRRRGNRILMCQSVPRANCIVKAPVVDGPPSSREAVPERVTSRLLGRESLTPDTALFTLDFNTPINFLPGQFMLLESPDGIRRAYSMAHPADGAGSATVEFIIRAKPGGAASAWLFDKVQVGEEILVEGPYGRAYAQLGSERPAVCIAGGTGLAPILAITEELLVENGARAVDLYIGARMASDVVLLDRLARLGELGARVFVSVEDPNVADNEPSGWQMFTAARVGRVIDHVAEDWTDLSEHDIYLAGPAGMVDAALRALVRERGACADRLFFDRFIA